MAEKRRFLDVWIVETNTVYQEVPFEVVCDWVQQGRLLADDMVRPSGTREWYRLGGYGDFAPYFPRPEPHRAEDAAEALEPVETGFSWRRPLEEEDDDVDMIPLIDVSLVLLIFFMLTATAVAAGMEAPRLPSSHTGWAVAPEGLVVQITLDENKDLVYSVSEGAAHPGEEDRDIQDFQRLMQRIQARLPASGQVELTINAHKDVKSKYTRELLVELRKEPYRSKIRVNYYGTTESDE
jgi:biopolymer transport protein ExbD